MEELDLSGIGELDLSEWSRLWDTLVESYTSRQFGLRELMLSFAGGNDALGGMTIMEGVKSIAADGFKQAFISYSALIAVSALAAVIDIIARDKESVSGAAGFICFCIGSALIAGSLTSVASSVRASMDALVNCMEITTPVMTAALAATGSAASGALMQSLTGVLSMSVAEVFAKLVLPLASAAGVAAMLCAISEENAFERMFAFFKSAVKWITGAVFTIYFGTVSIQGITVARADSIALRTAKYTLGQSVPIVGGAVSGTMDTILSSAAVIKNAAGAAAVASVALIVASPLISIACSSLACRAVAAVCAPIGDKRIPRLLSHTAEVYSLMFAALTAVALMFIITAGLVFAAGNP